MSADRMAGIEALARANAKSTGTTVVHSPASVESGGGSVDEAVQG